MSCHFLSRVFPLAAYTNAFLLTCGVAIVGARPVNAQEVAGIQIGISASSDGDGDFASSLAEGAAGISFVSPTTSFSLGSPSVDPNSRSQLFNLLANQSIRDELELTDQQYGGVKQILEASQKSMSQLIKSRMTARGGDSSVRISGSDFQDLMAENRAKSEEAIEEILLPEQMKRVRQLAYQVEISRSGISESLVNGRLGKEIGVYDDQKEELANRAAKIEKEAKLAILAIKSQARAKLFKELTPDQRKAAEELLGDFFDYEEPSLSQQISRSLKSLKTPKPKNAK